MKKHKKVCPNCGIDHDPDWHDLFQRVPSDRNLFINDEPDEEEKQDITLIQLSLFKE